MTASNSVPLSNRRRSLRRQARSNVQIECRKGYHGLGANLANTVLDVSDRGARLVVREALDMKKEVEVILSGYGLKKALKCKGTVCWQVRLEDGSYCVGVEFQKPIPYRDWQTIAAQA